MVVFRAKVWFGWGLNYELCFLTQEQTQPIKKELMLWGKVTHMTFFYRRYLSLRWVPSVGRVANGATSGCPATPGSPVQRISSSELFWGFYKNILNSAESNRIIANTLFYVVQTVSSDMPPGGRELYHVMLFRV